MKTIQYSINPIVIDNVPIIVDGVPANFEWFVRWILDTDTRFSTDAASLRAAMAIERAIYSGVLEDAVMKKIYIDDIYYEKLKQAANNPSVNAYPLRKARLCVHWIDAIDNAQ